MSRNKYSVHTSPHYRTCNTLKTSKKFKLHIR